MNKRKSKKHANWMPPKGYKKFFSAASDAEFKAKHPIGYGFLVTLAIVSLLLPALLFCVFAAANGADSHWILLGFAGGFIFGIGLFNFVAIVIKQYLGHLVSIVSFLIGGFFMWISWLLCF